MNCPSCNGEISATHKFCPSCGAPVSSVSQAPTAAIGSPSTPAAAAAAMPAPVGCLISSDSLHVDGFTPGMVLAGRYRIIGLIGRGGMGEVYRADLSLDRKVALKFLPDAFTGDPERMARFEHEAKVVASLNHPNIASIYRLEQAEGKCFIVMELVEGETLAQSLSKGSLPVDESLSICQQIDEGLEAAHEKGVIHRDLKPANVMITEGDKVKIFDFGLVNALSDEAQCVDSSHSPTLTEAMTRPGVTLGTTPAYMSPEQALGKPADKRADIWAFGAVLYEMLTGKQLFSGETVSDTLAAMLKDPCTRH